MIPTLVPKVINVMKTNLFVFSRGRSAAKRVIDCPDGYNCINKVCVDPVDFLIARRARARGAESQQEKQQEKEVNKEAEAEKKNKERIPFEPGEILIEKNLNSYTVFQGYTDENNEMFRGYDYTDGVIGTLNDDYHANEWRSHYFVRAFPRLVEGWEDFEWAQGSKPRSAPIGVCVERQGDAKTIRGRLQHFSESGKKQCHNPKAALI